MSSAARIAARRASPIILVAIDTVRSVRGWRGSNGSLIAGRSCCPFPISTSYSPCRRRSRRQNKALVYDILFKAAAETIRVIAADPKHLGAESGMIAILHTWGQTLTHHPHVHCIVPGGGLGPDGRWIACKPNFFLPVHVLSRCYRRLFLERLGTAFDAGGIVFHGELVRLRDPFEFAQYLKPLANIPWVVFAKRPFAGPSQILEYLGRYTHRVAIANGRLLDCHDGRVTFQWKIPWGGG